MPRQASARVPTLPTEKVVSPDTPTSVEPPRAFAHWHEAVSARIAHPIATNILRLITVRGIA